MWDWRGLFSVGAIDRQALRGLKAEPAPAQRIFLPQPPASAISETRWRKTGQGVRIMNCRKWEVPPAILWGGTGGFTWRTRFKFTLDGEMVEADAGLTLGNRQGRGLKSRICALRRAGVNRLTEKLPRLYVGVRRRARLACVLPAREPSDGMVVTTKTMPSAENAAARW